MRQQQTADSVVDTHGYCPQQEVSIISAVKDDGRFTAGKAREHFEEVSVAPAASGVRCRIFIRWWREAAMWGPIPPVLRGDGGGGPPALVEASKVRFSFWWPQWNLCNGTGRWMVQRVVVMWVHRVTLSGPMPLYFTVNKLGLSNMQMPPTIYIGTEECVLRLLPCAERITAFKDSSKML